MYIHIYIFIHTCTCEHMYICVYEYVFVCICVYVHVYTYKQCARVICSVSAMDWIVSAIDELCILIFCFSHRMYVCTNIHV